MISKSLIRWDLLHNLTNTIFSINKKIFLLEFIYNSLVGFFEMLRNSLGFFKNSWNVLHFILVSNSISLSEFPDSVAKIFRCWIWWNSWSFDHWWWVDHRLKVDGNIKIVWQRRCLVCQVLMCRLSYVPYPGYGRILPFRCMV